MHSNTLEQVRQQIYDCFERSGEALFNVCDARVRESHARVGRARSRARISVDPGPGGLGMPEVTPRDAGG